MNAVVVELLEERDESADVVLVIGQWPLDAVKDGFVGGKVYDAGDAASVRHVLGAIGGYRHDKIGVGFEEVRHGAAAVVEAVEMDLRED